MITNTNFTLSQILLCSPLKRGDDVYIQIHLFTHSQKEKQAGNQSLAFNDCFCRAPPFVGETNVTGGAFFSINFGCIEHQAVLFFDGFDNCNSLIRALGNAQSAL
jgi:hypothetical protein